jgi:hypothetical protein
MPQISQNGCLDFSRTKINRRQLLHIGSLGLGGLTLSQLLQAEAKPLPVPSPTVGGRAGKGASAKSVILLFQFGGPSHIDSFDPKPQAPREIRGEFAAIPTRVPGVHVAEHLPLLARCADKFSLIRSVQHNRANHNSGAYYSLTGREPLIDIVTANASAVDFPHPGSVVSYLQKHQQKVPAFVAMPTMIADGPFRTPGEFAGFLGKMHDPLWVLHDPNAPGFNVNELTLPPGVDHLRVADRQEVLKDLDARSRLADHLAAIKGMNEYQARAVDLLTSPATKKAFAIHEESDRLRDRYGRTSYGQSALLARRLVEAGVRFVTVYYSPGISGWDTHVNNFSILKTSRLPHTDRTVSALLEDLDDRGLLSETLVYWTGDFGRTPKVNKQAGRDHWPPCQTVLMAGGGIRGGQVYGSSDVSGAYPKDNPARPDEISATVFHALGLNPQTTIYDQLGRPMPISAGKPIGRLFG